MTLKFSFEEEDLVPKLDEFDLNIEESFEVEVEQPIEQPIEEEIVEEVETPAQPPLPNAEFLDKDGNPIELTEEDRELLEEEARAERNRQIIEARKQKTGVKNISKKVELPPKKPKMEMAHVTSSYTDCGCGEDEACDKCIDSKGY